MAPDVVTPIHLPDDDYTLPEVQLAPPIATVAAAPDDYPEFVGEAAAIATHFPTAHIRLPSRPQKGNLV